VQSYDKKYLSLQFKVKCHSKMGTEFQSFFEKIMQKAFSDYQIIRPYSKEGDRGNDGYRPSVGIYYQVYSPLNPMEKHAEAARKCKRDFEKLKANWDDITTIKTFYFVFNDKGDGSSIKIERALSELRKDNKHIEFNTFLSKDLEQTLFTLNIDDISMLGFDTDQSSSKDFADNYLEKIEIQLDKENGDIASKELNNIKEFVQSLKNDDLELHCEILEARALQKMERVEDAQKKYEELCNRFPDSPQPFLYLAEIYRNNGEFEINQKLIDKAEKVDNSHWQLMLEKLVRDIQLGNKIDTSNIDEKFFPENQRIRSNYYRIYSIILAQSGRYSDATKFIHTAIHLSPDKYSNYEIKLQILMLKITNDFAQNEIVTESVWCLLDEISLINKMLIEWGTVNPKTHALLKSKQLLAFHYLEKPHEISNTAKDLFKFILQCYYDLTTDLLLVQLLKIILLPTEAFNSLLKYLIDSTNEISDELVKVLIIQFMRHKMLISKGTPFFEQIGRTGVIDFINNIKAQRFDDTWSFLKDDLSFAATMADAAKEFTELRKYILENLPNDQNGTKKKLSILLNHDESNYDEAFDLLKSIDLSSIGYVEGKRYLEIARRKNAWEYVIIICQKLLQYEKEEGVILQLKLQLFVANQNLDKYNDIIRIGKEILSNDDQMTLLDNQNKENLLANTIIAKLRRGDYKGAKALLERFHYLVITFEFKTKIETEVYLKNAEALKALSAIVESIRATKSPTPEQYGNLSIVFISIGNLGVITLEPLEDVTPNSYVKFKNQERWYYVGDGNELDATKISSSDGKYLNLMGKRIGDTVIYDSKYRSSKTEYMIENIFSIEKYIYWQCMYHAKKLTLEGRWDKMKAVEVPIAGDNIDPKYLIACMAESRNKNEKHFDIYCNENLPIAFLAINEGSLTGAFARIANENKGFIKFCTDSKDEIDNQKAIAEKVISGDPFYIDGTSALVLSETGLLEMIYGHLPCIKIPQSVLAMLFTTKEKFIYIPGTFGYMSYHQDKLEISPTNKERMAVIESNFEKCIKLLETYPKNIIAISKATKLDCISEQIVPPELCDACILAHRDKIPILTEDFLYLQANEYETKKRAPEYFSTFALVRTLYEQGKISFDRYLEYFCYLSSYRFRFLPISVEDIENAVFGTGLIYNIQPRKIQLFNFRLTLSEEYGVTIGKAFKVLAEFLANVIADDSVLPEAAGKIFTQILSTLPKYEAVANPGLVLLQLSISKIKDEVTNARTGSLIHKKIAVLAQIAVNYSGREILIN